MNPDFCPCQSGETYSECCGPLHQHKSTANTAERLMLSRYSAFVLGNSDYLIETLHPSKRRPDELKLLQETISHTRWLGLKILDHKQANGLSEVEFVAFYKDQPMEQLHERSRFIYQDDQWFYIDGKFLPTIKLQRNDPCICGSGRKFKQCHGR